MEQYSQLLSIGVAIFTVLQIVASFPFWKYLLKVRDTVVTVDELKEALLDNVNELHNQHTKFKEDTAVKIDSIQRVINEQSHSYSKQINMLKNEVSEGTLEFSKTIGALNGTLGKLEGTINSFKTFMEKGEENLKLKIDHLSKDLDEHKLYTRDLVRELKR